MSTVLAADSSARTVNFPAQKVRPELKPIHTGDVKKLLELKDVCKHLFEVIIEESKYESCTIQRLANAAQNGLSVIECFEEFGH